MLISILETRKELLRKISSRPGWISLKN